MAETMQMPPPAADDVRDLAAYMRTLRPPRNPHLVNGEALSAAAERGRAVFESDLAGCAQCHSGPHFTDGKIHDVGLGKREDRYAGYNTPSLRGVYLRPLLTHDGRATSLRQLLSGPHRPDQVSGSGELTPQQLDDLIEYLKSL